MALPERIRCGQCQRFTRAFTATACDHCGENPLGPPAPPSLLDKRLAGLQAAADERLWRVKRSRALTRELLRQVEADVTARTLESEALGLLVEYAREAHDRGDLAEVRDTLNQLKQFDR